MAEAILSSAAHQDYAEALQWYLSQSVQAAERFDQELS